MLNEQVKSEMSTGKYIFYLQGLLLPAFNHETNE